MKTIIFTKEVIGEGGIVKPIGQPLDIEDDKEAQSYIDKGIAELAPEPTKEEKAAKAQAEAEAKAAAEAAKSDKKA